MHIRRLVEPKRISIETLLILILLIISISACNKYETEETQEFSSDLKLISGTSLPYDLEECSGVEIETNSQLWMINDSYNTKELFLVGIDGQIDRTIELQGVENNDWEDLSKDEEGNLYVGDFGNNDNDREDLAIYIIPSPNQINGNEYSPEIIHFTFENQYYYPPDDNELFFDTEAFFISNGKVYLFTKDRSEPFTGLTNMYEFPAIPGNWEASLIGSFLTTQDFYEGAITSADISHDCSKVALLSNEVIWLFTGFNAPEFLSGEVRRLTIPGEHQYEGIVFKNDSTFYLTNELNEWEETQLVEFLILEK